MAILPSQIRPSCVDPKRLSALRHYEILDTPAESDFDDIARLARLICQAPHAVISFVDADRQWFKTDVGLGVSQTNLDVSICAHAINQRELFVVPDTLADDRFANNPLVVGPPHLRFYAGALLTTNDGDRIGTLCVLDTRPRELSEDQKDALRALAGQVMAQLDLRLALRTQSRTLGDLERAAIELRAAKDSADAANRAKERFIAALSHELRTPLTPVLMAAESMAADEALPEETREHGRMIRRNVQLQIRLVSDLLDVSRINTGKLELKLEPTDLHELIRHSVAMCSRDAVAKNIAVSVALEAKSHYVRGDSARLQQLFVNLLNNAIKFTPAGGSVSVWSGAASGTPSTGDVEVRVTDTGIGLSPEVRFVMFDAFEQGGRTVTREYAGLGLGLAIAKGVVDAHEGSISASSDGPQRGTTLRVKLPTIEHAPCPEPAKSMPREAQASGVKILLVEDHEDSLFAMSRLLKRLKYDVKTATCLNSALEVANENRFDLLISDVGLPDGSGLDLMRQLIARQPIKGIALTGYGTESDVAEARNAGFSAHLTKPIQFLELEAAIRNLVP